MSTPNPQPGRRDRKAAQREQGRRAARPPAEDALSTRSWTDRPDHLARDVSSDVVVDCGWGRLVFGQTFAGHDDLLRVLRAEEAGRRDVCLYVREPQVLVSRAPQELFLDPSYTYRLWLHQRQVADPDRGLVLRMLQNDQDAQDVNRIVARAGMVGAPADVLVANARTGTFQHIVAEDAATGRVVGTVTGVDHVEAFGDPEGGTSLWALAVDPQTTRPGVGRALVRALAQRFQARGRAYLDLSVLHDNTPAIQLYEQMGFERVPVYCVKRKNPINEPLYAAGTAQLEDLNPYARVVADEALRRGVALEVIDAEGGFLKLSHGGRSVTTRESLSELTSAVAVAMCDDKRVTRRVFERSGLPVPRGRTATGDDADLAFLEEVGEVVVKPARGEQGAGITVGVTERAQLLEAVTAARRICPEVLVEERVSGQDLRIVVINHAVVAAAVRRPAEVTGTGEHTVEELIRRQSRRRAAATAGESTIPLDEATIATVQEAGFALDDVLGVGERLRVRGTANLHTGGTIHDVTDELAPRLREIAVTASRALDIPVVGLDLLVDDPAEPTTVHVIEANERPGLANHEPQPTAQRFLDLVLPQTAGTPG